MTRSLKLRFAAVPAFFVSTMGAALAAPPAAALTAIETYGEDVVTVVTALIVAGITIFAVKKLGSKMGWL